ncbi:MAG: O-antigen ligase family protein [Patescibacteria group bacterium]
MNFDKKFYFQSLLGLTIITGLSILTFWQNSLNNPVWLAVNLAILLLAIYNLEYGLYIVLGELFIGSFGQILAFNLDGLQIPIRISIFLIIMSVWLAKLIINLIRTKKLQPLLRIREKSLKKYYLILGIFILWGVIWGFVRQNTFANIFFDSNAWIYFFYILPFYDFLGKDKTPKILVLLGAGITINFLITFFSFIIFTQNINWLAGHLYKFIRDLRWGEITYSGNNLWRIFLQSQIYSLIGFLILASNIVLGDNQTSKNKKITWLLITISLLTVYLSLSRSFWLGLIISLIALIVWILFKYQINWRKIATWLGILAMITICEFGLIIVLAGQGTGDLLSRRLTDLTEAAGVSRFNQLKPLGLAIMKHPIIGSGFGTTVTYFSRDPRILEKAPDGRYTTYAFEWGYLDILLKIGLAGLVTYLLLIWQIIKRLSQQKMAVGLLVGLIGIIVTNIFSPYLNHPLGIGYLLLLSTLSDSN